MAPEASRTTTWKKCFVPGGRSETENENPPATGTETVAAAASESASVPTSSVAAYGAEPPETFAETVARSPSSRPDTTTAERAGSAVAAYVTGSVHASIPSVSRTSRAANAALPQFETSPARSAASFEAATSPRSVECSQAEIDEVPASTVP